jgi:hypothetical protein
MDDQDNKAKLQRGRKPKDLTNMTPEEIEKYNKRLQQKRSYYYRRKNKTEQTADSEN